MKPPANGQPIFNIPSPVGSLIGFTVLVHVALLLLSESAARAIYFKLVFYPGYSFSGAGFENDPVAYILSPVGYALLHAGWVHLLINMAWLLVFGSAVARRMSSGWFLLFYAIGALSGSMTMLLMHGSHSGPIIGASAAVAAVSGALVALTLRPRPDQPPPPRPFHMRSTAIGFVIVYLVMNILTGIIPPEAMNASGRVAWEAHLGGFAVGILIMPFFDGRGKTR